MVIRKVGNSTTPISEPGVSRKLPDSTVGEIIDEIKKTFHNYRSIYFVYVADHTGKFVGVVSLRRLLIAEHHQKVSTLLKEVKRLPCAKPDQSITEIATLMTKYNLFSVAVLGKDKKLLGVITVDDVMRHFMPHA